MTFKTFHIYYDRDVKSNSYLRCEQTGCLGYRADINRNCVFCGCGPNKEIPWNRPPENQEEKAAVLAYIGVVGRKAEQAIDSTQYVPYKPRKFDRMTELKELAQLAIKLEITPPVPVSQEQIKPVKKLSRAQIARQKLREDVKKNVAARRKARGQDD